MEHRRVTQAGHHPLSDQCRPVQRLQCALTTAVFAIVLALLFCLPATGQDERKIATKVQPEYPELAKKMNIRGSVKVNLTVAPDGTIKQTKVIGGNPVLVAAALDAIKRWKYERSERETMIQVELKFNPDH